MENTTRQPTPKDTQFAPFAVTDERGANWLLGKLAAIEGEQARVKAQTQERLTELRTDYDRLMHLYGDQLETFARAESERRRRKTVTLQQGTCAFRKQAERFVLEDDGVAFAEAEAHYPQAIRVHRDVDKSLYLDIARQERDRTGEIIPGVSVSPERETFAVKFGKKAEDF